MNPRELASALKKMADAIESSKAPSRSKVASSLSTLIKRVASQPVPVGFQVTVAPASGSHTDPSTGVHVEYELSEVISCGEKHCKVIGSVKVGQEPWMRVDCDIGSRGHTEYLLLETLDSLNSVEGVTNELLGKQLEDMLFDQYGMGFGLFLANCIDDQIHKKCQEAGYKYVETDGASMDWTIRNNVATYNG